MGLDRTVTHGHGWVAVFPGDFGDCARSVTFVYAQVRAMKAAWRNRHKDLGYVGCFCLGRMTVYMLAEQWLKTLHLPGKLRT